MCALMFEVPAECMADPNLPFTELFVGGGNGANFTGPCTGTCAPLCNAYEVLRAYPPYASGGGYQQPQRMSGMDTNVSYNGPYGSSNNYYNIPVTQFDEPPSCNMDMCTVQRMSYMPPCVTGRTMPIRPTENNLRLY